MRRVEEGCSSSSCPGSSVMPRESIHTLWRLTQGKNVIRDLCEALARHLNARLDSCKDGYFIAQCFRGKKSKHQLGATFRTWMLCQEQDAGLCSFCSGTISKPGREWYARNELRCHTAHIQNNRAKASAL